MVKKQTTFSCYLIGQDSLLLQCAEALIKKGHNICGIISSDINIKVWAESKQIKIYDDINQVGWIEFDYLFSIINFIVLPVDILKRPQKLAINYHDSLLPKYAGMHATSWAILNDEKEHGITWHVMSEQVDAGNILKQGSLRIEKDETALSLNLKCDELALQVFEELVPELAEETYQLNPQDLSKRSYYGMYQKPYANGFIDWEKSAEEIDRTVRALTFGNARNTFATAKTKINEESFCIIERLEILDKSSKNLSPRCILSIANNQMIVSTITNSVRLTLAVSEAKSFELLIKSNSQLPLIKNMANRLKEEGESAAKIENFWLKEWQQFQSASFPFLSEIINCNDGEYKEFSKIKFSMDLVKTFMDKLNVDVDNGSNLYITLLFIYLYRLGNKKNLGVGFEVYKDSVDFSTRVLPFLMILNNAMNFNDCYKLIRKKTQGFEDGYYQPDIFHRYADKISECNIFPQIGFLIASGTSDIKHFRSPLMFVVDDDEVRIFCKENYINHNLEVCLQKVSNHIDLLFQSLNKDYSLRIEQLEFLSSAENKKILIERNQTERPYIYKPVHQLFEEQVEKTPNQVALIFEEQYLSYRQLNERANQLASYLNKAKIKSESPVILFFDRSIEMIIGMLGVLKAGGAYVPVDPVFPETRIKYIIEDCQSDLIVTQAKYVKSLSLMFDSTVRIVSVEQTMDEPILSVSKIGKKNHLMYILYTSGSTGIPKGVLIEHFSVVNCIFSIVDKIKISLEDKFLAVTSLQFDVSVLDYFLPLLIGASVVICDENSRRDGEKISEKLEKHNITVMQATPATWHLLVLTNWRGRRDFKILTAGEALSSFLVEKLLKLGNLFNIYGPTEATIYSTLFRFENTSFPNIIGKPLDNVQVYILDENRLPVSEGVVGELYISGCGLARGYLNQPGLTNNHFIPNPFVKKNKRLMYKTGDLVRWLPDGNIEYIGRVDQQVKIRGHRIELAEIENALHSFPEIVQGCVAIHQEEDFNILVAYYVAKEKAAHELDEKLRTFLFQLLPEYMVPKIFVPIEKMPLSINGKINHSDLLIYYKRYREKNYDFDGSSSDQESQLYHIWKTILNRSVISKYDNFFNLGGDSILAMRLVVKLRERGLHIKVNDVFLFPTIAELSQIIKKDQHIDFNDKTLGEPFRLSPIQKWFFDLSLKYRAQWSQSCTLSFGEKVNPFKLYECLKKIIQYHDALRIYFINEKDEWKQCCSSDVCFNFQVMHINFSSDKINELIIDWQNKTQEIFDINNGSLFSAIVFINTENAESKLLFVIHHLLIDGVSWRIITEDLIKLYESDDMSSVILPIKTSSYKTWVDSLYGLVDRISKDEELSFQRFNHKEFDLPIDMSISDNFERDVVTLSAKLSSEDTQALVLHLSNSFHVGIDDILLAALAKVFERWTGRNYFCVDYESHGRDEGLTGLDLSRTVGWFTNIFPLELTWDDKFSFVELINSIKEQKNQIKHHGIGLSINRFLNNITPQIVPPQISFNYLGHFETVGEKEVVLSEIKFISHRDNFRTHLLNFTAYIKDDLLHFEISYNTKHFLHKTIKLLIDDYAKLLKQWILKENKFRQDVSISNYPLTSMQQGMLFHTFQVAQSGVYIIQVVKKFSIEYMLDEKAYFLAWAKLIQRHDVLRTHFKWENLYEPIQILKLNVEPQFEVYEWDNSNDDAFQKRLNMFLQADREAGFDLTKSSARLVLIRGNNKKYCAIFTFHHMIIDGWSLLILLSEFDYIYKSILDKKEFSLSAPLPYKEYVSWLSRQESDKAQIFWRNYLKGFVVQNKLSFIKKILERASHPKYKQIIISLSSDVTKAIKPFARQHGITTNTIFQGVWALLLTFYSQSSDVVFGVTVSGRSAKLPDLDKMVGLCINTLPLRVQLKEKTTVIDYLISLQKNFAEICNFDYTPLNLIKTYSELSQEDSLFETTMVFENWDMEDDLGEIEIIDSTHYPLSLAVIPGEVIKLKFYYDESSIDSFVIDRVGSQIQYLINNIIFEPNKELLQLDLMTAEDRRTLLYSIQDVSNDLAPNKTMTAWFEESVEKYSNNIAVVFNDITLTFAELNSRANQLSHFLKCKKVVSPQVMVAIFLDRSIETIISIIGIIKAGCAYVPIDPEYPEERIDYLLRDSRSEIVITDKKSYEKLKFIVDEKIEIVFIDIEWDIISNSSTDNPISVTTSAHLMYMIYTSGSTGNPKGVLVEHGNVVHLFKDTEDIFNFGSSDVWALFHSFSFDVSVWEMWGALLYGGAFIIVPYITARSPLLLSKFLKQHNITVLNQTPSNFYHLQKKIFNEKLNLRWVIFAGEALNPGMLRDWFLVDNFSKINFVNMYGITETTVHFTYHILTQNDVSQNGSPIGKPFPGGIAYVLDENLRQLPIGVPGELYVSGYGVTRGYHNQIKLTAERFMPNPFKEKDRLYKSGDMVCWTANGELEYLGRIDRQIKLRGFRIEPGELEHVLNQHPAIYASHVMLEDINERKQLCAYIIPDQESAKPLIKLLQLQYGGLLHESSLYELANGLMVSHLNKSETDFVYQEIFNNQHYLKHGISLKDGDCIFDVGANIGLFSLYLNTKVTDLKIYAFEPIPDIFEKLKENAAIYDWNVVMYNAGLSDENKTVNFTYYPNVSILSGQFPNAESERKMIEQTLKKRSKLASVPDEKLDQLLLDRMEERIVECQLMKLSQVIEENNIEQIDLLKIDVEKSELNVLLGIHDNDWIKIKQLVMEVHDEENRLQMVVSLLKLHGFELVIEQDDNMCNTGLFHIYARRDNLMKQAQQSINKDLSIGWASKRLLMQNIKDFLQTKVPDWMLSISYTLLTHFPLTPNGKLDYKALSCQRAFVPSGRDNPILVEDERKIANIFKEILVCSISSREDDFFNLGGDSLAVLQVLTRIHKVFGVEISVNTFYKSSTIKSLTQVVRDALNEKLSLSVLKPIEDIDFSLISFRSEGKKPPLFLFHPIGGTVFWYLSLLKYLDADWPVYGIQDPGIETKKIEFNTVEELASHYLKIMRKIQPVGPYFLAGASAGAILSVEIAKKLEDQNELVAFIGLFDGWVPVPKELENPEFFEAIMRRQFLSMRDKFLAKGIHDGKELLQLQWHRIQMFAKYKVPCLKSKLTLFKAMETIPIYKNIEDAYNHWNNYTEAVRVYLVPGDHETMFQEPNVKDLAFQINQCLQNEPIESSI